MWINMKTSLNSIRFGGDCVSDAACF